ncbi:hypothetical protein Vadar_025552 [Vaccinium darrowii]|uniref:Uncharacterized protein n=1 Tax=Vaccinium darrowii TaxID=229202 RepID=A0ACB7ZEB0_9ERIC|nr:hypothetical protein Vadar_025552 [Vaccinium darrowii]
MPSSSSTSSTFQIEYPTCNCGKPSPMRKSKTKENPGRRFLGCGNYEIFNWVHRKFHNKDVCSDLNVKKAAEFVTNIETDTQVLLENLQLGQAFEGWRDGIPTIGTFGFVPVSDFDNKNKKECGVVVVEKQEEELSSDNQEDYNHVIDWKKCKEEEVDPLLLYPAFGYCGLTTTYYYDENAPINKSEMKMSCYHEVGCEQPEGDEEKWNEMKKKKERTTLADLFSSADHSDGIHDTKPEYRTNHINPDSNSNINPVNDDLTNKKKTKKKRGQYWLGKKLIPGVGDDDTTHPIKKLNQLMTRMLKRKIHPDVLEAKTVHHQDPSTCRLFTQPEDITD